MRTFRRHHAFLLITILVTGTGAASPAETIFWYQSDYPPMVIANGPFAGQGYAERFLNEYVFPALPQFKHTIISAPIARLLGDVGARDNVCAAGLGRTPERESIMYMSTPFLIGLPHGATIRYEDLPKFAQWINSNGELELTAALESKKFVIGAEKARHFGSNLDRMVGKYSMFFYQPTLSESTSSLLRMLASHRQVDLVLGHSFEPTYLEETEPKYLGKLTWLPLQESNTLGPASIGCSKSVKGRQVVDKVNQLLSKPDIRVAAQGFYTRWLDEASRNRLDAMIKRGAY